MPSINEQLTIQDRLLFNMLFRQQVYLEGWKTSLIVDYRAYLRKLYGEFSIYLAQTKYQQMGQFTKIQLAVFIRKFTEAQTAFYSEYTAQLIKLLRSFLDVDLDQDKQIMIGATGKNIAQAQETSANDPNPDASGIYGVAALNDSDQLWANVSNAPIPANGMLIENMIKDFGTDTNARVSQLLVRGYANATNVSSIQQQLLGRGNDYTGGLFGLLLNQYSALIGVAVQHINAEVVASVASTYVENYQWVSVLDNKTTQICIERDGNVYIYGEGPLPPAWYNCRAKTIPLSSGDAVHDVPATPYAWLLEQPQSFLVDVLGKDRAAALLAGELSANDFRRISPTSPLTLDDLKGKIKYILGLE